MRCCDRAVFSGVERDFPRAGARCSAADEAYGTCKQVSRQDGQCVFSRVFPVFFVMFCFCFVLFSFGGFVFLMFLCLFLFLFLFCFALVCLVCFVLCFYRVRARDKNVKRDDKAWSYPSSTSVSEQQHRQGVLRFLLWV